MEPPGSKKQKMSQSADVAASKVPEPSGWASLNPELIGMLSRYLDLPKQMPPSAVGDGGASAMVSAATDKPNVTGNGNEELMNLCLVAGPKRAASIRHAYLRDNETFLLYSMLLDDPVKAQVKNRSNIRQWMEVNEDWKLRCSDPKNFELFQKEAIYRQRLPRFTAEKMFQFELVGDRFLRLKSVHEDVDDSDDEDFYDSESEHFGDLIGHYLIMVGNDRGATRFAMHGHSYEDMLEELWEPDDEGDNPPLQLLFLRHPDVIFGNPVFAAELGLDEVVQFLVEEKGLDVNGSWNGLYIHDKSHSLPVTACCLSPDISVLKYLLSVPGANFGFKLDRWPGIFPMPNETPIHWLSRAPGRVDYLNALLGHETVDITALDALDFLCFSDDAEALDKMRLLLKHGASDMHCRRVDWLLEDLLP